MLDAKLFQLTRQSRTKLNLLPRPMQEASRRGRMIGGEAAICIHAIKLFRPVIQSFLKPGFVEPGTLPYSVVRILDWQFGKGRHAEVAIEFADLPPQYALPPSIGYDMVHGYDQPVIIDATTKQHHPKQAPCIQMKDLPRIFYLQPARLLFALLFIAAARQIANGQCPHRIGLIDPLHYIITLPNKPGPKCFMTPNHLGENPLKGTNI